MELIQRAFSVSFKALDLQIQVTFYPLSPQGR